MNEDLIRRSDVLNLATCITKPTYDSPYYESVVYVEDIEAIPSVDVERVRHGEWLPVDTKFHPFYKGRCSYCGKVNTKDNYCPNCGAKMNGKRQQND